MDERRWHVRAVARGGACDSYVRVRAANAIAAAIKGRKKAQKRHPEFGEDEWDVIYLCVFKEDVYGANPSGEGGIKGGRGGDSGGEDKKQVRRRAKAR